MSIPEDVQRLIPLVMMSASEIHGVKEEQLPAGLKGILENFGAACFALGMKSRDPHEANTVRSPDPDALEVGFGKSKLKEPNTPPPAAFTRTTRPSPKTKRVPRKLPPPPRLPRGLKGGKIDE